MKCRICSRNLSANILQVCGECVKKSFDKALPLIEGAFRKALEPYDLPPFPPKGKGVKCTNCSNECVIPKNKKGYCGLRTNKNGKIVSLIGDKGSLYCYLDPHVTNCVAAFCCAGGTGSGYPKYAMKPGPEYGYYNLSVFMASCSMHCLFCQNYSYLEHTIGLKPLMSVQDFMSKITQKTTCTCFFGGCVVPQLDFVIKVSRKIREKAEKEKRILRICSETNGLENPNLLKSFAELSLQSGGGIKFDLKTFDENLSTTLSGTSNKPAYKNFEMLAELNRKREKPPFLRASTLLVPYYINEKEVYDIAKFIASVDENIPYSLLAFHPMFMMEDLPTTSWNLAKKCYKAAEKAGLKRVHLGNIHLLT